MAQIGVFSILMSSSINSNLADFKHLDYEHYVSTEQIHLLYLQWSKKYNEGALKPLKKKCINYDYDLDENNDDDYEKDCVYQNMISRHDEEMMLKIDLKDRQLVSSQNVVYWSHCRGTVFLKVSYNIYK